MTVYVDEWRMVGRSHMAADSLSELHAFAERIGVKRCWFHAHEAHPHYDVNTSERFAALMAGAKAVRPRELLDKARGTVRA